MSSKTKFTIITPVYNGELYIRKCIDSVINTNYDLNFVEHIIINDGSSDKTEEIVNEYLNKFSHIKYFKKENSNWGGVINFVKNNKLATGDYIFVCDADDFVLPKSLEHINNKLNKYANKNNLTPDLFCSGFKRWNGKNIKVNIFPYYFMFKRSFNKKRAQQYYSPIIVTQSTFIKNEHFYSLPDLTEKCSYQDTILFNNIFYSCKTIYTTYKCCAVYWYARPNNTMSQNKLEKGLNIWTKNIEAFASKGWDEAFTCYALGKKSLRKYWKKNNIKFNFKKRKVEFSGFPFIVRPILKLAYLVLAKKYINYN